MNKTIYVRDEDVPIWDRAKELAGDKLAPVIMDGLRKFVATKELEGNGYERIEVRFRDSNANNLPTAKAFIGRWIFPPDQPLSFDEFAGPSQYYAVAQTAKNRLAVLSWVVDGVYDPRYEFYVFHDIDGLRAAGLHPNLAPEIVEKVGVEVEELDI